MTAPIFTAAEKCAEVQRELTMRRRVFPQWVAAGKLKKADADRRMAILEAIAEDYAERDLFERVG